MPGVVIPGSMTTITPSSPPAVATSVSVKSPTMYLQAADGQAIAQTFLDGDTALLNLLTNQTASDIYASTESSTPSVPAGQVWLGNSPILGRPYIRRAAPLAWPDMSGIVDTVYIPPGIITGTSGIQTVPYNRFLVSDLPTNDRTITLAETTHVPTLGDWLRFSFIVTSATYNVTFQREAHSTGGTLATLYHQVNSAQAAEINPDYPGAVMLPTYIEFQYATNQSGVTTWWVVDAGGGFTFSNGTISSFWS